MWRKIPVPFPVGCPGAIVDRLIDVGAGSGEEGKVRSVRAPLPQRSGPESKDPGGGVASTPSIATV